MQAQALTKDDYLRLARELAREAGVPGELHGYFEQHRDRLWTTLDAFGVLRARHRHVLCIGPFFDYTPFVYAAHAADAVTVLEADPPTAVLEPLYRDRGISLVRANVGALLADAGGRLPWDDDTFDLVCCWETLEHFNFNPVPFVRELHRILGPGGIACCTVPNTARLDARIKAVVGRSNATPIAAYERHAGEQFFGFHWREYTLAELSMLFADQGFEVADATYLSTFQNRPLTLAGKARRLAGRAATRAVPAFSSTCAVRARKPA